jgi:hypothetical protein
MKPSIPLKDLILAPGCQINHRKELMISTSDIDINQMCTRPQLSAGIAAMMKKEPASENGTGA